MATGDYFNFPQQGWQCPVCKRVYSPTVTMCFTCPSTFTTTYTPFTQITHCPHGKKFGEESCDQCPKWTITYTDGTNKT